MNEAGRCDDAPRTLASTTRKEAVVAADTSGEHSLADQGESLAQQLAAVRTEVASLARMADEVSRLADRVAELAALRSDGTAAAVPGCCRTRSMCAGTPCGGPPPGESVQTRRCPDPQRPSLRRLRWPNC